jgi:hypothetical protein
VTRSPISNCAAAFLAALKSGDQDLVAVMLGQFRAEEASDQEAAAALLEEFAKVSAPTRKATRRSKGDGKPSGRIISKVEAAIEAATPEDDGTIIITREIGEPAGWSKVYFKYENVWNRGKTGTAKIGPQGAAAEAIGYTASLENANTDEARVILTPKAAEAA